MALSARVAEQISVDHSRRFALILANAVDASANKRASVAAVSGKRLGWQTVALTGQRMMTTDGVSSASTNSMASVSAALIWLEASSVILLIGISLQSSGISRPVGRCYSWRATCVVDSDSDLRESVVLALAWSVADLAGRDKPGRDELAIALAMRRGEQPGTARREVG
jgi:hypothetical protein